MSDKVSSWEDRRTYNNDHYLYVKGQWQEKKL